MNHYVRYIFAVLLLVVASCGRKDRDAEPATLPEPATAAYAQLFMLSDPLVVSEMSIRSIELTESSRYIAEYTIAKTKGSNKRTWYTKVGRYYESEGSFVLEGLGKLEYVDGALALDGESVPATSVKAGPVSAEETNASRNWKVRNTFVSVSGGSLGEDTAVEKRFDGLDFHEIASYLQSHGVSLTDDDVAKLEGYEVTEFIMTAVGSFVINFSGVEPVKGSFELEGESFSYVIPDECNPLDVGGEASGTMSFDETAGTAQILVDMTVHGSSSEYRMQMEFNLYEVE